MLCGRRDADHVMNRSAMVTSASAFTIPILVSQPVALSGAGFASSPSFLIATNGNCAGGLAAPNTTVSAGTGNNSVLFNVNVQATSASVSGLHDLCVRWSAGQPYILASVLSFGEDVRACWRSTHS